MLFSKEYNPKEEQNNTFASGQSGNAKGSDRKAQDDDNDDVDDRFHK